MILPRRGLLAFSFLLMVINRLSGLVLPLFDQVHGRYRDQPAPRGFADADSCSAIVLATMIQGVTSFSLTQLLSKTGQRLIAELAPEGPAARRAAQRGLLRRKQERSAGGAHHERCGGRAQPDRHRPGGFCWRTDDGGYRAGGAAADQPADDRFDGRVRHRIRADDEAGVHEDPADFSGSRQDQRGRHRAADGVTGRRSRGQRLSRRGARGRGFFRRRSRGF